MYLILEALNISRVANSMGSVGVAQRALAEALSFAQRRSVFGKPLIEQPLMRKQFEDRFRALEESLALAWESARRLSDVWRQTPPYSDGYHVFRVVAHLAKYWTAELAAQTAKWSMEAHGGVGALAEYSAERWFREAMILAIWEGTSHRQILDALEVIENKGAHRPLLDSLAPDVPAIGMKQWEARLEDHLALPTEEKEAGAEALVGDFARFVSRGLVSRLARTATSDEDHPR